jgi:hypothetical protein
MIMKMLGAVNLSTLSNIKQILYKVVQQTTLFHASFVIECL